jgi:CheY-like chemotaxis protein
MKIETSIPTIFHDSLKILIAEDEPELLRTYKILLEHEGYQIVTTSNGEECMEVYKAELAKSTNKPPFDVVLLDYRMPKKHGVEVAREILSLFPTQKLLMVTAYSGVLDLNDEKLKKMQVMSKPFDFEELFATISAELKNV